LALTPTIESERIIKKACLITNLVIKQA
jgi:hypothetical protein